MKSLLVFALMLSAIISLTAQQAPAKEEKKDTLYIGGGESFLTESTDWHNAVGYLIKKEFRPYKYVRKVIYLDEPKLMASYQCYDQKYVTEDSSVSYIKTIKDGPFEERYRNGQTKILCKYIKDELDGDFKVFYPSGQLKRHDVWQLGKWVEGKCFDETGAEIRYFDYVSMPFFPGGESEMYSYIMEQFISYEDRRNTSLNCTIRVGFIVRADGSISDVQILESQGNSDIEKFIEVIKSMPRWGAARVNDIPISVQHSIGLWIDLDYSKHFIEYKDGSYIYEIMGKL